MLVHENETKYVSNMAVTIWLKNAEMIVHENEMRRLCIKIKCEMTVHENQIK